MRLLVVEKWNTKPIQLIAGFIFLGLVIISCGRKNTISSKDLVSPSTPDIVTKPVVTSTYPIIEAIASPEKLSLPLIDIKIEEQLYIDPEGWFSVKIPAEWKGMKDVNGFTGESGFFETGNLPEMGYMPGALNVCVWLANINTDPQQNKIVFGDTCLLKSKSDSGNITEWIIENPDAGFDGRYFYIKSDEENFDQIYDSFQWLRPFESERVFQMGSVPVRSADIEFWKTAQTTSSAYTIYEYLLQPPEGEKYNPSKMVFFIPPGAKKIERKPYVKKVAPSIEEINETLKPIGFKFITGSKTYFLDLYKENQIVIKNIYRKSDIYTIPTSDGNKISFIVYAVKDVNIPPYKEYNNVIGYLIEDGQITIWKEGWEEALETWRAPLMINGRLLWVQAAEDIHVEVLTSDRNRVFYFASYFGAHVPLRQFREWDDHWILEIDDFLIQDGVILNEQNGFEQIFNWRLFKEKPFYFFRKGPNLGISYDGQFHHLNYEEIVHGFCCGLAQNNPTNDENMLRFYGRRGDDWYYVILEFN